MRICVLPSFLTITPLFSTGTLKIIFVVIVFLIVVGLLVLGYLVLSYFKSDNKIQNKKPPASASKSMSSDSKVSQRKTVSTGGTGKESSAAGSDANQAGKKKEERAAKNLKNPTPKSPDSSSMQGSGAKAGKDEKISNNQQNRADEDITVEDLQKMVDAEVNIIAPRTPGPCSLTPDSCSVPPSTSMVPTSSSVIPLPPPPPPPPSPSPPSSEPTPQTLPPPPTEEGTKTDMPLPTGPQQSTSDKREAKELPKETKTTGKGPVILSKEREQIQYIFLIYSDGRLISQLYLDEKLSVDAEILSGMLTAVQDFVRDSLRDSGRGLNSIQYGRTVILIERGVNIYMACVVSGKVPEEIRKHIRKALIRIQERNNWVLKKKWDGDPDEFEDIEYLIAKHLIEVYHPDAAQRIIKKAEEKKREKLEESLPGHELPRRYRLGAVPDDETLKQQLSDDARELNRLLFIFRIIRHDPSFSGLLNEIIAQLKEAIALLESQISCTVQLNTIKNTILENLKPSDYEIKKMEGWTPETDVVSPDIVDPSSSFIIDGIQYKRILTGSTAGEPKGESREDMAMKDIIGLRKRLEGLKAKGSDPDKIEDIEGQLNLAESYLKSGNMMKTYSYIEQSKKKVEEMEKVQR